MTLLVVACGGTVVGPDPGSSSSSGGSSSGASSGGSSSGASSSGASSSGASSSGVSSSSSGGSTSGSNGCAGRPPPCFGCNGPTPPLCSNNQWICPPSPPCPPPLCNGPPPPCACPVNCKCGAVCDPRTGGWTCTGSCAADAGPPPLFACGTRNCVAGDVCVDVAGDGGTQTGPYECLPNPSVCAGNYTCACEVRALEQAGTCKPVSCDQTFGNVVVHCASL